MTNKENVIPLIKTNPDIFPYLKEINNDLELVKDLYKENVDLTKYLSESLKKDKTVASLAINLNPLNILNFELDFLAIDQIFDAIKNNNKIIQFLNISDFKKKIIKNKINSLSNFDYATIKNDNFFIKDRNFMINALDKSPFNIIYFKNAFNTEEYKNLFLNMISKDYRTFQVLNNEFIEDEDFLIEILKINPETYTLFPNHKRNLSKLKKYVFEDGIERTFKHLTYNEKTEDIIYRYFSNTNNIEKNIIYAYKDDHPKLFKDKKILLKLILNDCIYFNEIDNLEWAKEEEILKILHNNGNFFTKLNKKQKENFILIKAATLDSKICCEEFFDVFNKYPQIIEYILENNISIFDKIHISYKKNIKWINSYLKSNPLDKFKQISEIILEDIETMLYVSTLYPEVVELMPRDFKNNKSNALELISKNPATFQYLDYSLRADLEVANFSISKDLTNINYIGVELYDEASIINNFFNRIISGESYEGNTLFILFFKDVMDNVLFSKALEINGKLYENLSIEFDKKEYLIAALKGGFQSSFNPMIQIDSELLYYLLKYHPDPIYVLHEDFFLTEEDMIIKVLTENPKLINKPFFNNYKINLSFAEKLINRNPESIVFIMDKYFLNEEIKDMSLIDKIIIENPENFNLISFILDKIEGVYLLNRDTITSILDYYISKKINKNSLNFLYKIPEILRDDKIFKRKYVKIFGEKTNFINELLFKISIMKGYNTYPFITERFEAMVTENREKEEEARKLEDLFHLRNFVDKNTLINLFSSSKMYKEISQKYYKNTRDLLEVIYSLKDRKFLTYNKTGGSDNRVLKHIVEDDIIKEDFIEYVGILYLSHLEFNEKDILKLYGYKNRDEKNTFIDESIYKTKEIIENIDEINDFIISSIFIENYSTLKHNCFDNDFKSLFINGKNYDIKSWRLYKTENEKTTLPLRNLLSALFEKGRLSYADIKKFYDSDISRTEKEKYDLIYTHKKKIEKKISPHLESLLDYKITILNEKSKPNEFSLLLER